ncbi:MAG TPA: hypothetical protein VGR69_10540 [Candidatus Rubrimentiphilum sp.]|nr:hypothetical protein [Candidatus Rubrimentiphilum sp.]
MKTIAAVHRLITAWLKRYFRDAAALAACRLVHFTRALAAAHATTTALCAHLLARLTAIGATVRLILKTLAGVKLLFAGRKRELASTVNTVQHFINVH